MPYVKMKIFYILRSQVKCVTTLRNYGAYPYKLTCFSGAQYSHVNRNNGPEFFIIHFSLLGFSMELPKMRQFLTLQFLRSLSLK